VLIIVCLSDEGKESSRMNGGRSGGTVDPVTIKFAPLGPVLKERDTPCTL